MKLKWTKYKAPFDSLDYLMYGLIHRVKVISNFLASSLKTVAARLALKG